MSRNTSASNQPGGLVNSIFNRFRYRRRQPFSLQSRYKPQSVASGSRGRMGAIFFHFSKRTTLHGVNHMAQAKNTRSRFFWIFIVTCASLGFAVNMYYVIEKYAQIPILTNVLHEAEDFRFPDISFCNLNPIYFPPEETYAYKHLMDDIDNYDRLKKGNTNFTSDYLNSLSDYLYVKRRQYSHPPWSFIVQCMYQSSLCNWSHFEVRSIWPYGNCYTLNVSRLGLSRKVYQQVTFKGFRPNFQVILYKGLNYPASYKEDPHASITMPSGIILMIHDADSYPHIGDSYLIDTCTIIGLKIVRKEHLEKLSKCDPTERFYTYSDTITNKNTTVKGNWADCIYYALQISIYENCKCLLEYYPIPIQLSSAPFCKNPEIGMESYLFHSCLRKSFKAIHDLKLNECYRDPCRHDSYTTVVSNARYPAVREQNSHMEWLQQLQQLEKREINEFNRSDLSRRVIHQPPNASSIITIKEALESRQTELLNIEFVERNFMMLRVVPSSLFMDKVEESEEYPLSRLMSDIGGCVGLWVGASLITLFEVIDLTLDLCEGVGSIRQQSSMIRAHRRAMSNRRVPGLTEGQQSMYNGVNSRNSLGSGGGGGVGISTIAEEEEECSSPRLGMSVNPMNRSLIPFHYMYSSQMMYADEEDSINNNPEMDVLLKEFEGEDDFTQEDQYDV